MRRPAHILVAVLALIAVSCGGNGTDAGGPVAPEPATSVVTVPTTGAQASTSTITELDRPVESDIGAFLIDYLVARQAGLSVDAYLSPNAADNYAADSRLSLHGEIDDVWVGSIQAADANSYEAVLRLDSDGESRRERVGVGPGTNLLEETKPLVIRFAVPVVVAVAPPVPTTMGTALTGEEIVAQLHMQREFDDRTDLDD